MSKVSSLSFIVGTGRCNAHCSYCAGAPLRKYAPKKDGEVDAELIYKTIKDCYKRGARRLSISSSGEPTLSPLSVTRTLFMINRSHYEEDFDFSGVHLYTNGIRIGEEDIFSRTYLRKWKELGLTTVYITLHGVDREENARVYGVPVYPDPAIIISRIRDEDLSVRVNLILGKDTINSVERFSHVVERLDYYGANEVSAWPIRCKDDRTSSELSAPEYAVTDMAAWAGHWQESPAPFGRIPVNVRRYHDKPSSMGKKLTLFPDGTLSESWCNH